ncbi:MAG: hypothetical protein ACYDBZ_09750 [Steroidobacteraceae bacterium]
MHYVGNNHVAFDPQALGFPSILGCQAVCFHVAGGLYGFHDMKSVGGVAVDATKAQAFATWAAHHGPGIAAGQALYGVINQSHQYTHNAAGEREWKTMLLGVATALAFVGPVYGARITSHVGKADSLYVRFDLAGAEVSIACKRWSKMHQVAGSSVNPDMQGVVRRTSHPYAPVQTFGSITVKDNVNETVQLVRRTDSSKDENLNVVPSDKITQFR